MRNIEIPTKQSHMRFINKKSRMRLLRRRFDCGHYTPSAQREQLATLAPALRSAQCRCGGKTFLLKRI